MAATSAERFASFEAVIRCVPRGRVVTYGQVAELAGFPRCARQVGRFLRQSEDERLPWHRVVNARGGLSPRGDGSSLEEQRQRLEAEGVRFASTGLVDLRRARWSGASCEGLLPVGDRDPIRKTSDDRDEPRGSFDDREERQRR
ncbi:MAG: MGMT family protein [Myxococcales bacterium]|nr:MGMT family protein [Myxococcales bacterium]